MSHSAIVRGACTCFTFHWQPDSKFLASSERACSVDGLSHLYLVSSTCFGYYHHQAVNPNSRSSSSFPTQFVELRCRRRRKPEEERSTKMCIQHVYILSEHQTYRMRSAAAFLPIERCGIALWYVLYLLEHHTTAEKLRRLETHSSYMKQKRHWEMRLTEKFGTGWATS